MAVMMPREKWTDERLDDLNKKVDDGFADTKAEIRELRRDMNERFNSIDARFDRLNGSIDSRFDKQNSSINDRFEALNRTLIGGLFVVVAAIIGSNVL